MSLSQLRDIYERQQQHWLASYAVREADCGGRANDEPEHDYRTCFQRDRDRIVHCSAFRRLDFKTQVFVPHEQDHYRTRLTHTLEVAQIARTLGRALRLNEDLIETAALAHDLGHPPFGHAGEAALEELMADHGHFEHNRQSLRVVDYLEHPYPGFRGLNITRVVRECMAKHQSRFDTPAATEFDPALNAPLEGQLVDLADEIAYTSADLEDALAVNWLKLDQLQDLKLWCQAWDIAEAAAPQAREVHKQIRAGKALLAILADDLLTNSLAKIKHLGIDSPQAARAASGRTLGFSAAVAADIRQMQDFLLHNVYLHGPNADKEKHSRQLIHQLFDRYLAQPTLLPDRYQSRFECDGLHRTICDFIAGMTDRYCLKEHQKHVGA